MVAHCLSESHFQRCEFKLTFVEALPLEIFHPLVGVVHFTSFLGLGVGKQIWVGLGDLGAWLLTGQEVKVLQPWASDVLLSVFLGGRLKCCCVGQLIRFGGQTGDLLSGRVHQIGSGRERGTPVIFVFSRAIGRTMSSHHMRVCLRGTRWTLITYL